MVLNIVVSSLVAALIGMGVGGGGLFVIYLTLCLNYPQILSQGTNLFFFIIAGVASAFVHIRRRKINPYQFLVMSVFGSIGSLLFSQLVHYVSPEIPRKLLGALLVITGIISLYKNFKIKKK